MSSTVAGDETSHDLTIADAAVLSCDAVLERFGTTRTDGLSAPEVARRRAVVGPNVIAVRRVRPWEVLARQLRSALLLLLVVTAAVSFFVGDRTDAVIIGTILVVSVGLGFINEYRAELAAQALHTRIRHEVVVRRDGHAQRVDVTELVPGDVVRLTMGQIVPADVRIITTDGLECDESVFTGESRTGRAVGSSRPRQRAPGSAGCRSVHPGPGHRRGSSRVHDSFTRAISHASQGSRVCT